MDSAPPWSATICGHGGVVGGDLGVVVGVFPEPTAGLRAHVLRVVWSMSGH